MDHQVIISLASNHEQQFHLAEARRRLKELLHAERYTEEMQTLPCGEAKRSDPYLNQLLYASTALTVDELQASLKDIERQMGRTQEDRSAGIVRIDLDLMQYDDDRYHQRDWSRPYIQQLLLS